jgi:molecular chaperone GrpE
LEVKVKNNSFSQKESMCINNDQDQVKSSQGKSVLETEKDINNKSEKGEQAGKQTEIEIPEELTEERINDLKKKAEERDSFLDELLRNKAEFTNYQKRMIKENEATAQLAVRDLILDLLPELDNFDRALKLANNSNDIAKFVEGIKLIEVQLFKVLGKYGVKSIETTGEEFDPNFHEAVMEEENNKMPHHTIIAEFQRGFLLKERVVRPAKVKVSKRIVEKGNEGDAGEEVHIKSSDNVNVFHKERKSKAIRRNTQIGIILGVIITVIIGVFFGTRTNVNEQKISDLVLSEGITQQHEIEEININDLMKKSEIVQTKEVVSIESPTSEHQVKEEFTKFTQPEKQLNEAETKPNESFVEVSKNNTSLKSKWEGIPEEKLEDSHILEKPQIAEEVSNKEEGEETLPEDEQQVASVDISTKTIHKVIANDSLFKIAKEYFGDGTKWNKIFEANKDNMSDPHSLYVGQKLLIPDITVEKVEAQAFGVAVNTITHIVQ